MKKLFSLIFVALLAMAMLVGCSSDSGDSDVAEVEAEGLELAEEKKEQDKRVVAGTVMASEMLEMLDIELVGVPSTDRGLPERYSDVEAIGMPMNPDLEKILSVEPDVFITDGNLKDTIDALLGDKGIEIIYLTNNSYQDLMDTITELGAYFERQDRASEILADMKSKEEAVLQSVEGKESPNVMIIFGTTESFMLATKNSFTGSLVEQIGGENVTDSIAEGGRAPYVDFSLEQAVQMNPDVILRLTHMSPQESSQAFEEEFSKDMWQNLDAVREGRVHDLDPRYFGVTANMRASESIEKLAELIYE